LALLAGTDFFTAEVLTLRCAVDRKPRRAGQQSMRFNSLNRSLGSIF
jgi:hypothetical protein